MGAPFNNFSISQNQNLVGIADRAEAMGDHETGASDEQVVECRLDLLLCPGVDTACRLVEDENARVGQSSASDCDQLALPLAETGTRVRPRTVS